MAAALNILFTMCLLHGVLNVDCKIFLPTRIRAVAGSCVTIPCFLEFEDSVKPDINPTCEAIWRGFEEQSEKSYMRMPIGEELKKDNCTYTMSDVKTGDGPFSYFFYLKCDEVWYASHSSVKIDVRADPPKPTLSPSVLEVKEGASVTLECSAPAPCPSLPPTVTWSSTLGTSQQTLKDNKDKTKVLISTLTFTASHSINRQMFSCTAAYIRTGQQSVLSVSNRLIAHVDYVPKDTKVLVSPSGPVPEGTDVVLKCSSDANPPVKIYTWYRSDPEGLTLIHTGPDLTVKTSRNTGTFLCEAENDVGSGRSNKTNIEVQYVPKDTKVLVSPSGPVPEGTDVVLKCSSDANPPVKIYTWYRSDPQGLTLIHTGPDLTIKASRNTGTFLCEAENDVGSGRSNKRNIDVQFVPQILSLSNCTQAAATVSCSCYTVGNPPPRLQWYLDGLSVNHSDKVDISSESLNGTGLRSIITLNHLQVLDQSTVLCNSSNSVGSTRRQFYLHSFEDQTRALDQGQVIVPAILTTVCILLILVCAVCVIRKLKTGHPTNLRTVSMIQLLDGNDEVSSGFTNMLSQENEPTLDETSSICVLDNAQGDGQSSAEKKQEGTYSSEVWKSKEEEEEENIGDA